MTLTALREQYRKHIHCKARPYFQQCPGNTVPVLIKNSKGVTPRGPAYKQIMRREAGV